MEDLKFFYFVQCPVSSSICGGCGCFGAFNLDLVWYNKKRADGLNHQLFEKVKLNLNKKKHLNRLFDWSLSI